MRETKVYHLGKKTPFRSIKYENILWFEIAMDNVYVMLVNQLAISRQFPFRFLSLFLIKFFF